MTELEGAGDEALRVSSPRIGDLEPLRDLIPSWVEAEALDARRTARALLEWRGWDARHAAARHLERARRLRREVVGTMNRTLT